MKPGTWMTSCPEALRIWEFEKKTVSWDSSLEIGRRLWSPRGKTCWGLRNVPRVCWRNWVSLSLLMSKNLKSFVPEPISCFSDSYMHNERFRMLYISIWIFTLHVFISWSYFWTWLYVTLKIKELKTGYNEPWFLFMNFIMIFLSSRLWLKNTQTTSLQRVKTPSNEYPVYNTKQSDCA